MATQTLRWIALPNGRVAPNGNLRLSVMVSPRLTPDAGDPTLAAFPAFHDWPNTIRNVTFGVSFDDGAPIAASIVGPAPRSDLWKALFKPSTPVTGSGFPDSSNRLVRSFPVRDLHDFVRQEYVSVATASPTSHPPLDVLGYEDDPYPGHDPVPVRGFADLGAGFLDRKAGVIDYIQGQLEAGFAVGPPSPPGYDPDEPSAADQAFTQAELFHARHKVPGSTKDPHREIDDPLPPVPSLELEFHRVLVGLGRYPALLRLLGLVRDLEVVVPSGFVINSTVRVVPSSLAAGDLNPRTAALLDATSFTAAPNGPEIKKGFLDLSGTVDHGFDVVDVDIDGAALQTLDFGANVVRSVQRSSLDTPDAFAVPSLRSTGLTITQRGRDVRTHAAAVKQSGLDTAGADAVLNAEDLVRGYRMDVWDDRSGRWHTICARRGTYQFPGLAPVTLDDEGFVSLGATSGEPGIEDQLFVHETMFRWTGWSAVAPRPGKVITEDEQPTNGNPNTPPVVPNDSTPDPAFPVKATAKALPGSLPALRFGRSYKLRVRTADVAGNGPALDPVSGDENATAPFRYGRFEPVEPPYVVPRQPSTPGESADMLVIRSNYQTPSTAASERHIAPPRAAELRAEEHGIFDNGLRPSNTAYSKIATHEAANFTGGTPDPEARGAPYHTTATLAVPYIPDPISRGASFVGLPGFPADGAFIVPFGPPSGGLLGGLLGGGAFPNAHSFRIVVVEGPAGTTPIFDGKKRTLTVRLPKAAIADVKLSCYLNQADLDTLGIWRWIFQDANGSVPTLRTLATQGRHWMLTPFKTLRLVHAVRQPLTAPRFTSPSALRELGQPFATLTDTLSLHRASTGRFDIDAQWDEFIDDLSEPAPRQEVRRARPFGATVDRTVGTDVEGLSGRHELGDTKHRFVRYTAVATSRFVEHFAERRTVTLTGTTATPVDARGFVPGTVTVRTPDGATTYQPGVDFAVDDVAGTVRRASDASAIPSGAAVRVEFVAPSVTRSSTEASSAPLVDVRSAARPAAPRVRYVVPTFGWTTTTAPGGVTSVRRGNGLRVYLERPWYSSGQGEQLAVVLWRQPVLQIDPEEERAHLVTQLGRDPLWTTGLAGETANENPKAADFPLAVVPAFNLSIPELAGSTLDDPNVDVAPHNVAFDEDRGLWSCDIELAGGATYTPFVRLALARYQLHSLPDAHLSQVVLADFAQLSPTRSASITFVAGSTTNLNVAVTGLGHTGSRGATLLAGEPVLHPSEVEVTVQTKQAGLTDELSWVDVPADPTGLTATPNGDGTTTWSGQVTLPAARGSQPFRLVFEEYEVYEFDASGYDTPPEGAGRRLVYVDTLEI